MTLTVTLQPNGQVDFQLPTHKLVAYGMLELARAQLDKFALVQEIQAAKPPRGGMEGFLKRMNGG